MTGQMFLQGGVFFLFNQVSWLLHNKFVAELETSLNCSLQRLLQLLMGEFIWAFSCYWIQKFWCDLFILYLKARFGLNM